MCAGLWPFCLPLNENRYTAASESVLETVPDSVALV